MAGFLVSAGVFVDCTDDPVHRPAPRPRPPEQAAGPETFAARLQLEFINSIMPWDVPPTQPQRPKAKRGRDDYEFVNLSTLPIDFPSQTWDCPSNQPQRRIQAPLARSSVEPVSQYVFLDVTTLTPSYLISDAFPRRPAAKPGKTQTVEFVQPWSIGAEAALIAWMAPTVAPQRKPAGRSGASAGVTTGDVPPSVQGDMVAIGWATEVTAPRRPPVNRPRPAPEADFYPPWLGAFSIVVSGPFVVYAAQISFFGAVQAQILAE